MWQGGRPKTTNTHTQTHAHLYKATEHLDWPKKQESVFCRIIILAETRTTRCLDRDDCATISSPSEAVKEGRRLFEQQQFCWDVVAGLQTWSPSEQKTSATFPLIVWELSNGTKCTQHWHDRPKFPIIKPKRYFFCLFSRLRLFCVEP